MPIVSGPNTDEQRPKKSKIEDQSTQSASSYNPTPKTLSGENKFNPNTVFISNLKFDLDEAKIKAVFEKVTFKQYLLIFEKKS